MTWLILWQVRTSLSICQVLTKIQTSKSFFLLPPESMKGQFCDILFFCGLTPCLVRLEIHSFCHLWESSASWRNSVFYNIWDAWCFPDLKWLRDPAHSFNLSPLQFPLATVGLEKGGGHTSSPPSGGWRRVGIKRLFILASLVPGFFMLWSAFRMTRSRFSIPIFQMWRVVVRPLFPLGVMT